MRIEDKHTKLYRVHCDGTPKTDAEHALREKEKSWCQGGQEAMGPNKKYVLERHLRFGWKKVGQKLFCPVCILIVEKLLGKTFPENPKRSKT